MRPLNKTFAPAPAALFDADRLMSAIGPYCSLCERPIHDRPALWDTGNDVLVERVGHAPGEALLVLCVNCADWQRQTAGDPAELALPHQETTMRVRRDSPYVYTLERITLRVVDEDGAAEESQADAAIVSGTTPAAAATIRRFRLNTPWYDETAKTLTVPRADHLQRTDRRVELRTEAWKRAEGVLPAALAARQNPALAGAFAGVRHLIEQTGFWSVWLTLFWGALPDGQAILPLFAPDPRPAPRLRRTLASDVAADVAADVTSDAAADVTADVVADGAAAPPTASVTLLHGTSTDFLD
jgi:hypothetical protein